MRETGVAFACNAHFWRRFLELLHDLHIGATPEDEDNPEADVDNIADQYLRNCTQQ